MANRFAEAIGVVLRCAEANDFRVALIGGFALPFHGVTRMTNDIDFLVDSTGREAIHEALLHAGQTCLQKTDELANYSVTPDSELAPVDLLFAHRPRALKILDRARPQVLPGAGWSVPVVDAEGLIGLKVQSIATNPARRLRDGDDIREILRSRRGDLDLDLVRDYYRVFGLEAEWDAILQELEP